MATEMSSSNALNDEATPVPLVGEGVGPVMLNVGESVSATVGMRVGTAVGDVLLHSTDMASSIGSRAVQLTAVMLHVSPRQPLAQSQ